jgi:hypothetical protein
VRHLDDITIQNKIISQEHILAEERIGEIKKSENLLIDCIREGGEVSRDLGEAREVQNLQSLIGKVSTLSGAQVEYPQVVIEALTNLYKEYNKSFGALVAQNQESSDDYKLTKDQNNQPVNCFVQVDMVGLTPEFLHLAQRTSEPLVREALRQGVFEIENSLAMYQLLENMFSGETGPSRFSQGLRKSLDDIRSQHQRPIALLAVTEEKLAGMRAMEFGKTHNETLSDAEVRKLSGFDCLMGPNELKAHLSENNGECKYLLYVRSSEPLEKLKSPSLVVSQPLLADDELRRIIKQNSITLNVDAPKIEAERRINDTKAYLIPMRMGFKISGIDSLIDVREVEANAKKNGKGKLTVGMLNGEFREYLEGQGIDCEKVVSGEIQLRAKPLQGTYGCYGHVRGSLNKSEFRGEVNRNIKLRGEYIIQTEIPTPRVRNTNDGMTYTYIDRNFLSCTGGEIKFLGGFRSMIPVESVEARNGRIHGSKDTIYGEIV